MGHYEGSRCDQEGPRAHLVGSRSEVLGIIKRIQTKKALIVIKSVLGVFRNVIFKKACGISKV